MQKNRIIRNLSGYDYFDIDDEEEDEEQIK